MKDNFWREDEMGIREHKVKEMWGARDKGPRRRARQAVLLRCLATIFVPWILKFWHDTRTSHNCPCLLLSPGICSHAITALNEPQCPLILTVLICDSGVPPRAREGRLKTEVSQLQAARARA